MSAENPTPGEIRTNHERATKAAAALTEKGRNYNTRVTAICEPGKPALLRVEDRPHNSRDENAWTVSYTVETAVTDRQGVPVTYSNEFSGNHSGTMTRRVYERSRTLSAKRDGLRSGERRVEQLREELAAAEAWVVSRKADIERLRGGEARPQPTVG